MKTLRFYQVINEELVLLDTITPTKLSYGVDYNNWPDGAFFTVHDTDYNPHDDGPASLHTMFNDVTQLDYPGELFLLEHRSGGKDVIRLSTTGEAELVTIDNDTIGVVFSLLQCAVFDKIETEDLFENFIRKGVDGLCEQIQSAVYDGLRKLP